MRNTLIDSLKKTNLKLLFSGIWMIMQIMRGSCIRIGVKNNSNCGIGNTEIIMFLSQRPKNYSI